MSKRARLITMAGWLMAGIALPAAPLHAQTLPDPTRPPPEALAPAAGDAPHMAPRSGPQLQSVLIGTSGREVAVIDGQVVRLGEKFDGALLVKVSKNEVVLRRGAEVQVLTLVPPDDTNGKNAGVTKR